MGTSELDSLLQEAIAFVNQGELSQGQVLLEDILEKDPQNDQAWVWLSGCVDAPIQRRICLQQALRANPNNQAALDGMRVLDGEMVQVSTAAPSLVESRLAAIGMGEAEAPPKTTVELDTASIQPVPSLPDVVAPLEFDDIDAEDEESKPRKGLIFLIIALLALSLVVCGLVVGIVLLPILPDFLGNPF